MTQHRLAAAKCLATLAPAILVVGEEVFEAISAVAVVAALQLLLAALQLLLAASQLRYAATLAPHVVGCSAACMLAAPRAQPAALQHPAADAKPLLLRPAAATKLQFGLPEMNNLARVTKDTWPEMPSAFPSESSRPTSGQPEGVLACRFELPIGHFA